MKFPCTVKQLIGGEWLARSTGTIVGLVERTGTSRENAIERLRAEIRYRIEWCPCSGVVEEFVELEVKDEPATKWRKTVF
jgi:hypothetical protein